MQTSTQPKPNPASHYVPGCTSGAACPIQIDLTRDWERAFWCRKFDCSEQELQAAVDDIGPVAQHVRDVIAGWR